MVILIGSPCYIYMPYQPNKCLMHKLFVLLSLAYLMICLAAHGQGNWRKGYVVFSDKKDTVRGYVLKGWYGDALPQNSPLIFKRIKKAVCDSLPLDRLASFRVGRVIYWLTTAESEIVPNPIQVSDALLKFDYAKFERDKGYFDNKNLFHLIDRDLFRSDSIVANRVVGQALLITSSFVLFRSLNGQTHYYLDEYGTPGRSVELMQLSGVSGDNWMYSIDRFKVQLLQRLDQIHGYRAKKARLKREIETADYDDESLVYILKGFAKLEKSKILYHLPPSDIWIRRGMLTFLGLILSGGYVAGANDAYFWPTGR